ncbi:MAG: hypothetical protein DMG50_27600 [Acidobacteria bacterium]|nr:MAG: hypothetical protein DMG50_27600 [Acidobacteriota bacterium]
MEIEHCFYVSRRNSQVSGGLFNNFQCDSHLFIRLITKRLSDVSSGLRKRSRGICSLFRDAVEN